MSVDEDSIAPSGAPRDPHAAARLGGRPELPKRFYKQARIAGEDGAFRVELDGRPIKTPGRNQVAVPSRALAELLAAEWEGQGERIDPMTMPLTRLVNSALDGVAGNEQAVADEIVRYAGSDLLCYRADSPARLVALQRELWDPILAWARSNLGAQLLLSEGIVFIPQPQHAIAAIASALPVDPLQLAALNLMTTLSGSALLALAVWRGEVTASAAWRAAHIDEEAQEELWGVDSEAKRRRDTRAKDFAAAAACLELI